MTNFTLNGVDAIIADDAMAITLTFASGLVEPPDAESRLTIDEVREKMAAVHQRILERIGEDLDELAILKHLEVEHINRRLDAKAAASAEKTPSGTETGFAGGSAPAPSDAPPAG